MHHNIILILNGMAMGAANVIPGVSGGTIAFITGIYERLINAIKAFDFSCIRLLFQGRFLELATKTDLKFISLIFLGVFVSIISLAKAIELVFVHYEVLTLAFFFGLIVASVWAVGRQVQRWNTQTVTVFIVGLALALSISFLPPTQPNANYFYVFLCGIVAVCSMILPGLSGSYILLLMGNYVPVLRAISSFDFSVLIPLTLGVAVGLILFSRMLSYLFTHHKDFTIATLSGFVTGSLLVIWPWKATTYQLLEGKSKAVGYIWEMPSVDLYLPAAIFFMFLGFFTVWMIERNAGGRE